MYLLRIGPAETVIVRIIKQALLACVVTVAVVSWPDRTAFADDEWIPANAVSAVQGNIGSAKYRARQMATSRAIARFLQNWLSVQEIRNQSALIDRWFFSRSNDYVAAVSDVETSTRGNRVYWTGRVQFDQQKVLDQLRELGLVSLWDRDPVFALQVSGSVPDYYAGKITRTGWYKSLQEAGIRFRKLSQVSESDPVDGTWTLSFQTETGHHPLVDDQPLTVTTAIIDGDVLGTRLTLAFPLDPPGFGVPLDLATAAAVDRIVVVWGPEFRRQRSQNRWRATGFEFADPAVWADFDRRIFSERGIFHGVHAESFRRNDTSLHVEYGFFLNQEEEANARAWLLNNGWQSERSGERSFRVWPSDRSD